LKILSRRLDSCSSFARSRARQSMCSMLLHNRNRHLCLRALCVCVPYCL
jgi:hypothetical protein